MELQKITNIIGLIILLILPIYIYQENNKYTEIISETHASNISYNSLEEDLFDKIPDISNEQIHQNLCENIAFQPNAEELLKENNCDIEKTMNNINLVKRGINIEDLNSEVKWNGKRYALNIWISRLNTMLERGYSEDRILDLLTIMTMECNTYNGSCDNGDDIGPLQINRIHDNPSKGKMWYSESKELYNHGDWSGLFTYQLDKANILLDSYNADLCRDEYVEKYGLGNTFEQKKWRCVAFLYNGHPQNKFAYNKLGWEKREIIKKYLEDNNIF